MSECVNDLTRDSGWTLHVHLRRNVLQASPEVNRTAPLHAQHCVLPKTSGFKNIYGLFVRLMLLTLNFWILYWGFFFLFCSRLFSLPFVFFAWCKDLLTLEQKKWFWQLIARVLLWIFTALEQEISSEPGADITHKSLPINLDKYSWYIKKCV